MPRRKTSTSPRPYRYSVQLPELMADTAHLEPAELGCYMRLLFSYWRSGAPKNDDRTLARITGLPIKEWSAIRPEIEVFFDVDREWIHWRTDDDLLAAYEAINGNKKRTVAAREAKKRLAKERDSGCDSACDNGRDSTCNTFLTVSKSEQQNHLAKPKAVFVSTDAELELAVSAIESGFGGGK